MMKCFLLLLAIASCCPGIPILAPAACVTGSLSSYIGLGASGCSVATIPAELQFRDVGFAAAGGGPLTDAGITVTPSSTGYTAGLSFTGSFAAGAGDAFSYVIAYTIDPPPIIHGFEVDLITESPSGGGRARVTTELCYGAEFTDPLASNACSGTLFTLSVFYDSSTPAPTFQLSERVLFAPVNLIGVRNTVVLEGQSGISDIGGFRNAALIPEPATFYLVFPALALFLLRRRG